MNKQSESYKAGYDAGKNGPNTTNCHHSFFATRESTTEWEAGQKAGKADRSRAKKTVKK